MKLSDELIRNYKLKLDGEEKTPKEFKEIFKEYFINPCLFKLITKMKEYPKEKYIVQEFKDVKMATDYLSEKIPYFKKGWFVGYILKTYDKTDAVIEFAVQADYTL